MLCIVGLMLGQGENARNQQLTARREYDKNARKICTLLKLRILLPSLPHVAYNKVKQQQQNIFIVKSVATSKNKKSF